jgi:uncharacterized membrane protein YhaH (DUF805 family)
MRGEILTYDSAAGTGLIGGDDGLRYAFSASSAREPSALRPDVRVDFTAEAGQAVGVIVLEGTGYTPGPTPGVAMDNVDWQRLLLGFEGRIRRQHFWIGWLILLGVGVVAGWIPFVGWILSLALIWPNTAIAVKRLHDMGQTGWLVLIPWVAGIAGLFLVFTAVGFSAIFNAAALENEDPAAIFALIGPMFGGLALIVLVQLGFLLWIGLTDGQRGDNRYGPNPKGL